jgi:hypothetical protein
MLQLILPFSKPQGKVHKKYGYIIKLCLNNQTFKPFLKIMKAMMQYCVIRQQSITLLPENRNLLGK